MSRFAAGAALLMVGCLIGCGSQPVARVAPNQQARGYHPERFPDLPLPPGFVLEPDRDQLAVSVGGGLLRRFDVSLVQKPEAKAQTTAQILEWYGTILPGFGWIPASTTARERSFHRVRSPEVAERLRVSAHSSGGVTGVRLRLEPAAPATTTP